MWEYSKITISLIKIIIMGRIGKIALVLVFGVMLLNMTFVSKCDNIERKTQISSSTNFNVIKIFIYRSKHTSNYARW